MRNGAFFSIFRDLQESTPFLKEKIKNHPTLFDFAENFRKSLNFDYFKNIFQEKSVNSCRSRKMLKNAPFPAAFYIGFLGFFKILSGFPDFPEKLKKKSYFDFAARSAEMF